jgi:hypothetical protein
MDIEGPYHDQELDCEVSFDHDQELKDDSCFDHDHELSFGADDHLSASKHCHYSGVELTMTTNSPLVLMTTCACLFYVLPR